VSKKTIHIAIVSFVLSLGFMTESASACPNCKTALDGNRGIVSKEQQKTMAQAAKGYNYSIIFMMPVPFLIAAGLGGMLYWHVRKNAPPIEPK
jgi:hypothetical protein